MEQDYNIEAYGIPDIDIEIDLEEVPESGGTCEVNGRILDNDAGIRFIRGLWWGILFSLPFWILILLIIL